jgi:hypothetical protein
MCEVDDAVKALAANDNRARGNNTFFMVNLLGQKTVKGKTIKR